MTIETAIAEITLQDFDNPLPVCIVFLDSNTWLSMSYAEQNKFYLFVEKVHKNQMLFYCEIVKNGIYKLIYAQSPKFENKKFSEPILQKIFDKHLLPKIDKFEKSSISMPKLYK